MEGGSVIASLPPPRALPSRAFLRKVLPVTASVLPVFIKTQSDGDGFVEFVQQARRASGDVKSAFDRDFAEIKRFASQSLAIPRNQGGSLDLGVAQHREAAANAQAFAQALREVANASVTASREAGDISAETRRFCVKLSASPGIGEALRGSDARLV